MSKNNLKKTRRFIRPIASAGSSFPVGKPESTFYQRPKRMRILDTPVDCVDLNRAVKFVNFVVGQSTPGKAAQFTVRAAGETGEQSAEALEAQKRKLLRTAATPEVILSVNPEKVYLLRKDPELKEFFEDAALLIPDGIGIVKALGILHKEKISRCPGADLMPLICKQAVKQKQKIFVFGSSEKVNSAACEILQTRYPGLQIAGRSNGYVKPEEYPALIDRINQSQADILFVAMGSPRQEKWMSENLAKLTTVKLCQGIGGTLDTITGEVRRAPVFMQKLNLEWFFRFLCQPTRFKRQLRCFKFAAEVYQAKFSGVKK